MHVPHKKRIFVMHVPHKKRNTSPLRIERLQRRWSQRELAERVGATVATVKRWERRTTVPGPHFRAKLTALFGKNEEALGLRAAPALPEPPCASEANFTVSTLPWNVPYQRNPFFTGRKKELDTLHKCLNTDRVIALTQSYALHGLGGIGKTQLAVEYAYSHAREYTAVLWISAETEENIITSFLHIAELLHLPECQRTNQLEVVVGVQRWLTSQSRWLLIWDNLEEIELLHRYLPPTYQGAILITTRCQSLGTLVQGIELFPMAQEEGVLFLLRRAKILSLQATSDQVQQVARLRSAEYAMAEEIVRIMDGLPLALDQVGAYVEEAACSLTGYFRLYRERKDLLDRRGKPVIDHPQSTTATLLLAYKSVERASAAAAELLCLCAFLHPDAIPEELLVAGAACLGSTLQAIVSDLYQLDQAIALLRTYSLVSRFSETQTLTIHRLIQTVLKNQMDEVTIRQWAERVV
jgi:transcriptional regulator with XRE-family HTH domain